MNGIAAFLNDLKTNPRGALVALAFLIFYVVSNNPDLLGSLDESIKQPIIAFSNVVKAGAIAYGLYYSTKTLANAELESKLSEIQEKPNQTVLPPKELVEAAPKIQEIVAPETKPAKKTVKKKVAKKVAKKKVKKP